MDGKQTLVIDSFDQLRLLGPYARRGRRRFAAIALSIDAVPAADRPLHETRLNRLFFACGCAEGTLAGLVAVTGILGWTILARDGGFDWWTPVHVVAGFILATGLGKYVGIKRAEFALKREVAAIMAHAPALPVKDGPRCAHN